MYRIAKVSIQRYIAIRYRALGGEGVNWIVFRFEGGGIGTVEYNFDWEGWEAKEHTFFAAWIRHFVNYMRLMALLRPAFLCKYPLE